MNNQRKSLIIILSVAVLAVVLGIGSVLLIARPWVHAADDGIGVLDKKEHFTYYDAAQTQINGLSDAGKNIVNNCNQLHVSVPEGVTYILGGTFEYAINKLSSFESSSSLISMSDGLFNSFTSLTSVDLSKSTKLTVIDNSTFERCSNLSSVKFPDSLEALNDSSFAYTNLISVDLSKTSLRYIEYFAFSQCVNLTIVEFPASLISVEEDDGWGQVFGGCNKLTALIAPNADLASSWKTSILSRWSDKVTYPIGVQINLTDQNKATSIQTEKTLSGKTNWHYVNGAWVENANYQPTLPALPDGWIWQNDSGVELTADGLKNSLNQAANNGTAMTINATAVYPIATPTINGTTTVTVTYNGRQAFNINDYNDTMLDWNVSGGTLANGVWTVTNADTYTATVTPKDGVVWSDTNTNEVRTLTVTVEKAVVDLKDVKYSGLNVDYDGTPKAITVTGYPDTVTCRIEYYRGVEWLTSAPTAAGVYTVHITFTLKDATNYEFANPASVEITETLTIKAEIIAAPQAVSKTYTYNAEPQVFEFAAGTFDASTMAVEYYDEDGTNKLTAIPTNAGTYTVKVVVTDASKAFTGNQTTIEFPFVIAKAQIIPTVNQVNSWIDEQTEGESTGYFHITLGDRTNGVFTNFSWIGDDKLNPLKIYTTEPIAYTGTNRPGRPDETTITKDVTENELVVEKGTPSRYVVYYRAEATNHETYKGYWCVEVTASSDVVKIIFKRPITLTYGADVDTQYILDELTAEANGYLEVTRNGGNFFEEFFKSNSVTGVKLGTIRQNAYGKYDAGTYYIAFELADNALYPAVIYRDGGNDESTDTNRDKLVITPKAVDIKWDYSKLEYTYAGRALPLAEDMATILPGQELDGDLYLDFYIDVDGEISHWINSDGQFTVYAVLAGINAQNYCVLDGKAQATIQVYLDPAMAPADDNGMPVWIWILVAAAVVLVVAGAVVGVVMVKKRNANGKPTPTKTETTADSVAAPENATKTTTKSTTKTAGGKTATAKTATKTTGTKKPTKTK